MGWVTPKFRIAGMGYVVLDVDQAHSSQAGRNQPMVFPTTATPSMRSATWEVELHRAPASKVLSGYPKR